MSHALPTGARDHGTIHEMLNLCRFLRSYPFTFQHAYQPPSHVPLTTGTRRKNESTARQVQDPTERKIQRAYP